MGCPVVSRRGEGVGVAPERIDQRTVARRAKYEALFLHLPERISVAQHLLALFDRDPKGPVLVEAAALAQGLDEDIRDRSARRHAGPGERRRPTDPENRRARQRRAGHLQIACGEMGLVQHPGQSWLEVPIGEDRRSTAFGASAREDPGAAGRDADALAQTAGRAHHGFGQGPLDGDGGHRVPRHLRSHPEVDRGAARKEGARGNAIEALDQVVEDQGGFEGAADAPGEELHDRDGIRRAPIRHGLDPAREGEGRLHTALSDSRDARVHPGGIRIEDVARSRGQRLGRALRGRSDLEQPREAIPAKGGLPLDLCAAPLSAAAQGQCQCHKTVVRHLRRLFFWCNFRP